MTERTKEVLPDDPNENEKEAETQIGDTVGEVVGEVDELTKKPEKIRRQRGRTTSPRPGSWC